MTFVHRNSTGAYVVRTYTATLRGVDVVTFATEAEVERFLRGRGIPVDETIRYDRLVNGG